MIQLILLSACVSLLTVAILFIQRVRPRKISIPSFFLGQKDEQKFFNLKPIPPRWWEVMLVVLATAGAGAAFFSQPQPEEQQRTQGQGLIWFDSTFSHVTALRSAPSLLENIADSLQQMRKSEYVFIELSFTTSPSSQTRPTYQFKRIPSSELEEHLAKLSLQPTALSQPIDAAALIESLKRELNLDAARMPLTLVTDAQSETLRPMAVLAENFQSIEVIRTPLTPQALFGKRVSVVPEELAQLWIPQKKGEDSEVGLPGTPQLMRVDSSLARYIPTQARPILSLEEFSAQTEESKDAKSSLTLIVSEEAQTNSATRIAQPLLTTCTLDVAGPTELDGLSDLRAYATFFKTPLRPLACRSTESTTSARAAESSDPWKYRRASVWVIPVNEYITGELFQQGRHWIPEGFAPETDAIVYIADTRLQGYDSGLESASIQLESNQPTIRLPLLPLPPTPLSFPWEMDASTPRLKPRSISTQKPQFEETNATDKGSNSPVMLRASDGTPLAYQLATQPPTFYLRTGGAAPNGELGRWGKWAALWNSIKDQLKQTSPLLTRIQIKSPAEWAAWLDAQRTNNTPPLRYRVDPITLKGSLIENRKDILKPEPALYIRERDDQLLVVEPPNSERQSDTLSQQEVDKIFPQNSTGQAKNKETQQSRAAVWQITGMLLALCSLLVLWYLQQRQKMQKIRTVTVLKTILFISFSAFAGVPGANAQGNRIPFDSRVLRGQDVREHSTHPFRIAWCDATIPEPVAQRYSLLQKILASRGTIELPKELLPGACRVGAAEIWWTSSLEALQAARVTQHIRSGGVVIAEGISLRQTPEWMIASADPSIGLVWESPKRRGLLYRSFYLLSTFDACSPERTLVLSLRKKVNAQTPMGIVTPIRFLTNTSEGSDCFVTDDDYRTRSFVNLMYALLTTDYKEDQMQLPEILNRIRSLGLEP